MTLNSFYILSVCFAGVMLLKVNVAWSDTSETGTNAVSEVSTPMLSDENLTAPDKGSVQCLTGVVAEAVQNEKLALQKRAVEITKREEALKALEMRVNVDLKTLNATNATIKTELDKLQNIAAGDLTHLVSMYETMKPKKAAEIFSKMDPKFAAGFIRQIKPATAGLILAEMDSTSSYKVSLIIANQNLKWRNHSEKN
jgi:flagellar motility protein MotE (MotC chaperone)